METIRIQTGRAYDVVISPGGLKDLGKFLGERQKECKICVVTDSHVAPLYLEKTQKTLEESGFVVTTFVFPAGEKSKNPTVLMELLEHLAEESLARTDLILALGGGVVGDLAGFAAAIYLRGIHFIQVPTTLLAMVDSSVGGKTAVDLKAGKNLCGAFWQPSFVLIDPDLLQTLPPEEYTCGMGEVIKYALLYDKELFELLEQGKEETELVCVIASCIRHKQAAVEADEFDRGARQFLNLGHTFGHAVELASDYHLSHGAAVAVGMMAVANAAKKKGLFSEEETNRLAALLQQKGLPIRYDADRELVNAAIGRDKKKAGYRISLVVPRRIGYCELMPMTPEEAVEFYAVGGAF